MLQDKDLLSIQQARHLVEQAHQAGQAYRHFSQEKVDRIVEAMARAASGAARRLAELAVEETGYGKAEDKTIKNLLASVDVYRYIRDLKTCDVIRENREKKVIEIAVPAGVIAVITPTTNPTSTVIFKILCALKGRNTVVVSPHPYAVRCTAEAARIMGQAAQQAGAPPGCVNCMDQVTLEGTSELMHHPRVNLILATGGTGLVRAAYSSGKPAYGVGPGNVPAFIERTANVPKAVRDVILGKTFDWGVLCSSEQSLICDSPIEEQVLEALRENKAHLLDPDELEKLERLIQSPDGRLNTAIVGKSPQVIAEMAGFSVPSEIVCLVGRCRGVGREYPLSREKLSPILAFFVEDGWERGCERCIEILNFGGLGHTMSIHSSNHDVIMQFGLHKPAYRICVNTPSTHGSVGLTTGVPPSMTLGCGTPGGNITSDNITPLHLINIKRLAFETRPADQIRFEGVPAPAAPAVRKAAAGAAPLLPDRESIRSAVRTAVAEYLEKKTELSGSAPTSPPLSVASPRPRAPLAPATDFVCEDDVRQALKRKEKIVVGRRTIITPAARDLGEERGVFTWESVE